jgi:hypothetical protein
MKIAAILFFSLISLFCYGQKKSEIKFVQRIGPPVEATYVLVLDTTQIIIDYQTVQKLNKKWVKDLRILKDDEQQAIYGHQNGVMIIVIKQRYIKKALRQNKKK